MKKYLWKLLIHKWYVFLACKKVGGIPLWRMITHDWSKLLFTELMPYYRRFALGQIDNEDFLTALLHHWNYNPHHYQYWQVRNDHTSSYIKGINISNGCYKMPETYVREMVADWLGASKSYTGTWDMNDWIQKNVPNMKLHIETYKYLVQILKELNIITKE